MVVGDGRGNGSEVVARDQMRAEGVVLLRGLGIEAVRLLPGEDGAEAELFARPAARELSDDVAVRPAVVLFLGFRAVGIETLNRDFARMD